MGLGSSSWGCVYLQDAYGLQASEGSLCDVADGVVAQAETVEISQHRQTAFIQASQVVVRQISGARNRAQDRQKRGRRQTWRGREEKMGGGKRNMCEVWKKIVVWQNSEAACGDIKLEFYS